MKSQGQNTSGNKSKERKLNSIPRRDERARGSPAGGDQGGTACVEKTKRPEDGDAVESVRARNSKSSLGLRLTR